MPNNSDVLAEVNKSLREYLKQGYHIPGVTVLTELPQFMRPSVRVVQIDTKIEKGKTSNDEIYSVGGGKFAFGRLAIQQFAAAGRIDLRIVGSVSVQRGKDFHRYSARVAGARFELDGAPKHIEDEKAYDLDVRAEEIRRTYELQVESEHPQWGDEKMREFVNEAVKKCMILKQKFAPEMAITGAQGRVVSKMLGLKPAYTLIELRKPFVIIAVTPVVDMRDPDIKRMVTAHMLGIREQIYPQPAQSAYMPLPNTENIRAIEVVPDPASVTKSSSPPLLVSPANIDDNFSDYPRAMREAILRRLPGVTPFAKDIPTLGDPELRKLYGTLKEAA